MFKVLSCVIYTIINRYVCIDYLRTEKKKISELRLGCNLQSKHDGMDYYNLFGIVIPDRFLNMLWCHGRLNNNDSIVILKCPNRISEYYLKKGFIELTRDEDHLNKPPLLAKQRVRAEVEVNSDLVMLCKTTLIPTSNTLKNLVISSYYHSSYSTEKLNTEK